MTVYEVDQVTDALIDNIDVLASCYCPDGKPVECDSTWTLLSGGEAQTYCMRYVYSTTVYAYVVCCIL